MIPENLKKSERVVPLTKWPDEHPWPSVPGLRNLVFFADENGFDEVVQRAGRRVLIKEGKFFKWLEKQNGTPFTNVAVADRPQRQNMAGKREDKIYQGQKTGQTRK